MKSVQTLIVGQGLAGTAVAWSMLRRGQAFHILDDDGANSSSRVAAGLMTPITGQRAVDTWLWDEACPQADELYTFVEKTTGSSFFFSRSSLRLFDSEDERERIHLRFEKKPSPHVEEYDYYGSAKDSQPYQSEFGGFLMRAYRLDTRRYLDVSRQFFQTQEAYSKAIINLDLDIEADEDGIVIHRLGLRSNQLVLAQGYDGALVRWFPELPISPVQGDVLTIAVDGYLEERTVHRGIWLTRVSSQFDHGNSSTSESGGEPTNDTSSRISKHANLYLVGSTHRRDAFDGRPSEAGRTEILNKLESWFKLPFRVVDHRAAIRPGSFDQKPLLGMSLMDPRIWIINGLGSKGSLFGPFMANCLADAMAGRASIPDELRWNRKRKKSECRP